MRGCGLMRLVLLALVVLLGGCAGTAPSPPPVVSAPPPSREEAPGDAVVATARSLVGIPYSPRGCRPQDGFDCSGFVNYVYGQHGVNLPRMAADQLRVGSPVPRTQLRPGDLVFFANGPSGSDMHVGVYSGLGRFIHSPKPGGKVREEAMAGSYWPPRYVGARRLLE